LKTRGKDYKTQDSECKGKDSHKLIIRETKKYTSAPWPYKREMDRLKGLRAKADYDNVEISPYDADKALLIANKLHKLLGI
jgi:hypothetical protein